MRHFRLLLALVWGLFWALLVAILGGFFVLNEEYRDAFDEWQR